MTGCDLDDCGVCRRCGAERETKHVWKEIERQRPCYRIEVCERCRKDRENPDHDWEMGTGPAGDVKMTCSRCRLEI
jgi:hypothetical protein